MNPLRTRCGVCGLKVSRPRALAITITCWATAIVLGFITLGFVDYGSDFASEHAWIAMRLGVVMVSALGIVLWRLWTNRRVSAR